MKNPKAWAVIGAVVLSVGLCMGGLAATAATGGGKVIAVTAVPTLVTGLTADVVTVYNSGADLVWAQVNVATGTAISNAAVAGTAVPIPANVAYTFDMRGKSEAHGLIRTFGIVTTNTSATVYVSWF